MKKTKKENPKKTPAASELRQDLVTGDWVVIATGRAKRPQDYLRKTVTETSSASECPFCYPGIGKQDPDTLIYYRQDKEWSLRVFPNKHPAFSRGRRLEHREEGIFFAMDGIGYHEVIVTRDHERYLPQLHLEEVAEVIDSFKTRYLDLMNRKSVNYIMFIENHGQEAGASLAHPHWQMFAIPVVSPAINLELNGSKLYKKANRDCVFCNIIKQEKRDSLRIVGENEHFLAFVPFAARSAFEVWIIPQKHQPYFERISSEEEFACAELLKDVLKKYQEKLNDIPFNMYLHTSPCDGKDYNFYHWHIELLPKTSTWAGFEMGTGIEISTLEPEKAAAFLKGK